MEKFGPKKWSTIASYINGRIGKQVGLIVVFHVQCRERWLNHLSPAVTKDVWTEEEDEILINAQIQMGNKWSYISKLLPGRSENAVKNRYNSIASRNGVRKKRLGTFVSRNNAKANLLRLHIPPKPEHPPAHPSTPTRAEPPRPLEYRAESSYAELIKKATEQINARNAARQQQRGSLQLPEEVDVGTPAATPVDRKSGSFTGFAAGLEDRFQSGWVLWCDVTRRPEFSAVQSPRRFGYSSTDLNSFSFDIFDPSDMTLTMPAIDSSQPVTQEEASLQQIDTLLLSGVAMQMRCEM